MPDPFVPPIPPEAAGAGLEQGGVASTAPVAPWMRGKGQGSIASTPEVDTQAEADAFTATITQDVFGVGSTVAPVAPIASEPEAVGQVSPQAIWPVADRRGQQQPTRAGPFQDGTRTSFAAAEATSRADALPVPPEALRAAPGSRWKRAAMAAIPALLLASAAVGVAYLYRGQGQAGILVLRSDIAGIQVHVDGRLAGKTPATFELKPGRHKIEMRGLGKTMTLPVDIAPGVQTTQRVDWPVSVPVGRLHVTSTPPGARVLMGVIIKGLTPVTIDDVPAGAHEIVLEGDKGSVRTSVNVRMGRTTDVDVPIYPGWLAVFAPVEMRIFEYGRMIGTTLEGRLLMPPGPHTIDITNPRLGYRETRSIEIKPGRVTAISIESPTGVLMVDAPAGTEVVVDGDWKATTPVESIPVSAGTHEVVLRHPQIGQRRFTVTVGVKAPATVGFMAPQ